VSAPYYSDDFVTLYHGDCREVLAWLEADVLVTDPPYGVAWTSGVTSYRRTTPRIISSAAPIAGDSDTTARDDILATWGLGPAIVFGSWRSPRPAETRHRLIWHKAGMAPGPVTSAFMTQDEEIYVLGAGWRKSSPPLRSVITTTEPRSLEVARVGHPTPKPVGLMEVLIDRCPPGTVTDPFAGSGSTLVASKQLGRRAIGVELDERYCEIAARRLEQDALVFDGGTPPPPEAVECCASGRCEVCSPGFVWGTNA
jgi:site-specific DNA-methyltransferase (adenine-specific)